MIRTLVVTWLAACTPNGSGEPGQTDTDVPDVPAPDCDFADFEGSWRGHVTAGSDEYFLDYTYYRSADEGEVVGIGVSTSNAEPPLTCSAEVVCVPRRQNEWTVVVERPAPDADDNCIFSPIWAFIRLDGDTLLYEAALTEYGERVGSVELQRVE
ncbi:MAG: hypothetical protein ACI9MC_004058 [Kiritimatiellia bacterium]|jgi:hypothetical protein